MYPTLKETELPLNLVYRGKVRDIYNLGDKLLLITTDRISAFDKVLNQEIPSKGTGLNQPSSYAFEATGKIIPNHFVSMPDPNVMIGLKTEQIDAELVIRGYLGGSALRGYKEGSRKFFIQTLPEGIEDYAKLEHPIITPTTKAKTGHDEPIETMEDFIAVIGDKKRAYELIEKSVSLYYIGNEMARRNGGSLFDTKFEFGLYNLDGEPIILVTDEIFTHDSSRFVDINEYLEDIAAGKKPRFIDKEPVREYLENQGFRGDGPVPDLPEYMITSTTDRIIRAAGLIMGDEFKLPDEPPTNERIMKNLEKAGILK